VKSACAWRFGLAALLGLPAALFAHALVFGGDHAVSGSLHPAAIDLAWLFAGICLAMACGRAACRRSELRVSFSGIAVSGAVWFGAIELCEQPHAIPFFTAALALAAAAWIARAVFNAFAALAAAVAVSSRSTRTPSPQLHVRRGVSIPPQSASLAHRLRLFSRPPPIFA